MAIILAVDIGSSSVRCTAYKVLSTNPVPVPTGVCSKISSPPFDANGRYDAIELTNSTEKAISSCLSQMSPVNKREIVAIGFDCFAMSFLGSDNHGVAITKVFSYAERSKATALYTEKIRVVLSEQNELISTHQRTGAPIHSAYAAPTLMRLMNENKEIYHRVECWQSFTSYLLQQWIEPNENNNNNSFVVPVSYSEASWTGIYNRFDKCWDKKLLDAIGMPTIEQKKMAPVKDYDNLPSTLRLSKTMLQKWPELSNARLYLGFGDGAMANIGSKCTNIERVAVTVGTSAALRVVVPTTEMNDTPLPSGLWCYSIDKEHSLLGGALTDGGSVHEFLNQIIPISTEEISSSNSTSIPVKDHHDDLVVLPFLSGERSPGWNDHARATIHGINRYTTKSDIRLAMYESVCLRLCSVFNLMLPYLDHSLKNIVVIASGTALKSNPMWKQMMADSLGTQLIVENVSEATSRGVALMIIKSLQKKDTIVNEMLNEKSEVWKSNEANHVQYEKKLLKQEKLYTSLYSDSNVNRGKSGSRSHNVSLIGAAMICGVVIGFTISQLRNSAR